MDGVEGGLGQEERQVVEHTEGKDKAVLRGNKNGQRQDTVTQQAKSRGFKVWKEENKPYQEDGAGLPNVFILQTDAGKV